MKIRLTLFVILLNSVVVFAQHHNSKIRKGNTAYKDSLYSDAEQLYREALMKDQSSYEASFNMADAIYKQERYSEANSLFKALSEKTDDKIKKSESYHNLGNSLLKEQKLDEAIEAYKNALRNNPKDLDTKHNLAYAMRMKNQNQEQEKEEQKEEDKKEEKEEQKEEEKDKGENQNEKGEQSEEEKKEEPKQPQDPNEMTEEEAQQILDALQQQEKELQEDLQKKKQQGVKLKILKDW
ncbi:MAG: tetratricopeptide repeat protein [Flavobacteriales bacterium]|nr:tetratricopeptide repeat protein [Flavobacteriales bacterium]